MALPIFLYPSMSDDIKEGIFQAKRYIFSYSGADGQEHGLVCETDALSPSSNCLRTDGIWSADRHNLIVRREIALKKYRNLFGEDGVACRSARLGLSMIWTSPDSRQRGATKIMEFGLSEDQIASQRDSTFTEGEIDFTFPAARIRGEITFSVILYIARAGIPADNESHLANEEGLVLGTFDTFTLRIDGTGSLFPVFEVHEIDQPLWRVRCDWTDPTMDLFSETVSIYINAAHKNFRFIDRTQKTFCAQLLVEVMSAALCCIIEKVRSEKYLDQILGDEEVESGSVGEVVRYFSNTLGWDFSTPERLSVSTRTFFDKKVNE